MTTAWSHPYSTTACVCKLKIIFELTRVYIIHVIPHIQKIMCVCTPCQACLAMQQLSAASEHYVETLIFHWNNESIATSTSGQDQYRYCVNPTRIYDVIKYVINLIISFVAWCFSCWWLLATSLSDGSGTMFNIHFNQIQANVTFFRISPI